MKSISTQQYKTFKNGIITGAYRALPIIIGYIPIGFAFGVLAKKVGISSFNTLMMSLIVFAGSSQLIAVGLVLAGVSAVSIIATTFIVNLRHMLMTAALSPYLKKWRKIQLALFSSQITDETFAIHTESFLKEDINKTEFFTVNVASQVAWVFGTIVGILASGLINDIKPLALDYALPAMFIGLLVFQMKNRIQIVIAVLSGSISVALLLAGMNQWNVIVSTLIGATLGVVIEKWVKKQSF